MVHIWQAVRTMVLFSFMTLKLVSFLLYSQFSLASNATGQKKVKLTSHGSKPVRALAYAPASVGDILLSGGDDQLIHAYDSRVGEAVSIRGLL